MRIIVRGPVLVGATFLLAGCGALGVGGAAALMYPVIQATSAPKAGENGVRAVPDAARGWQRTVRTASGATTDGATYRAGEALRVEWTIPLRVNSGVEALVGLSSATCVTGAEFPPMRWMVRAWPSGVATGEAWFVERATLHGAARSQGRYSVGVLAAEALSTKLGVRGDRLITWILILPEPGGYELAQGWEGADPREVLTRRPCVDAWLAIPLSLALEATSGPPPQRQHAPEPGTIRRTGDEGVSRGVDARPQGATPVPPMLTESATIQVALSLNLLEVVDYDIARLHQAALELELDGASDPARAGYIASLRELRADRLARAATLQGREREAFCRLAGRPGMGDRPLKAWSGQPTIPLTARSGC
jgi:hypothetical protein